METPRLNYNMPPPFVVARDEEAGAILLGGLGVLGVGEMWRREKEDHKTLEGYEEAPSVTIPTADLGRL